jgi:host factor-I protein|tara:strand:- start:3620 stop:4048 length:429 start_codon:yes stop_codon:yes gene_type:complete
LTLGWHGKDHAITADSETTITNLSDPGWIRFGDRLRQLALATFQDQKVIAKSLIFAELQHGVLMADPNPMETAPLDPSLPGVRLLQSWIREQLPISVDVIGAERIEGRLIWQDSEFLAVERLPASRPVLIGRRQISVIRVLG